METIASIMKRVCGAPGAKTALAGRIGVSPAMVSQWMSGTRPIPVGRCFQIEQATNGEVRRWDLRPDDWFLIWPEIVGQPNAPAVAEGMKRSDRPRPEPAPSACPGRTTLTTTETSA